MKIRWSLFWLILVAGVLHSCSHTPKVPEPEPSPTASPTPSPSVSASPSPTWTPLPVPQAMSQKFVVYYGNPTRLKYGWGAVNAIAEDWRFTARETTKKIVRDNPDSLFFGYLALGYSDSKDIQYEYGKWKNVLTEDDLRKYALDWKSLGVQGIFLDMAGLDYAYDRNGKSQSQSALDAYRARQLAVQKMLREIGMLAMWNPWNPQDLPWSSFSSSDWFLFESIQAQTSRNYVKLDYWAKNHPAGARAYGVTTGSFNRSSLTDAGKRYGLSGIQWKTNEEYENED